MYRPGALPPDAPEWLKDELRSIAEAIGNRTPFLWLDTIHAQPKKLAEGLIVKADGTNWNPGSGAGVYCYRGGSWRFLG